MKTLLAATTLVLAAIASQSASAASFNCSYAKLPAEVAICQYGDLSGYDEEMASLYYQAIRSHAAHDVRTIKRQQKWFINARNRCGYDYGCILTRYQNRIDELHRWN